MQVHNEERIPRLHRQNPSSCPDLGAYRVELGIRSCLSFGQHHNDRNLEFSMVTKFQRLTLLVQQELAVDIAQLSPGSSLLDLADSLDWVGFLSALEDEFGLSISTEKGMQLHTIADLLALVGADVELTYVTA